MTNDTTTTYLITSSESSSSGSTLYPSDEVNGEFHWCRHYLPDGVLIASTVVSLILSLIMINAMCGATCRFARSHLRRIFYPTERKVVLVQYALCMPLFELFVIWGTKMGVSADTDSASIVVSWLVINAICLVVLGVSCCSQKNYRLLIRDAQSFRFPMSIVFFCDRAFNSVIGVECIFIILLMAFSVFEFFHVQDYFAIYAKAHTDATGLGGALDSEGPMSPLAAEARFEMFSNTREHFMHDELIQSVIANGQRRTADMNGSPRDSAEMPPSSQKRRTNGVVLEDTSDLNASTDGDDDDDDDEEQTELEEGLPKTVRGALNEQKTNALIADLLLKAMQCTEETDAHSIKRAVLKFKRKMQAGRATQRSTSSTATATHDSEF